MKRKSHLQKNRIVLSIIVLLGTMAFLITPLSAQVGINNSNPDASAALDITSTDKGLLIPRVSGHTIITSPATGLLVYDTSTDTFWYFNGSVWTEVLAANTSGNLVLDGKLGIGTNPSSPNWIEIESSESDIKLTSIGGSPSTIKLLRADEGLTNIKSSSRLGEIEFRGYDGTSYITGARIRSTAAADAANGDAPARLVFQTSQGGGVLSSWLTIREDGVVYIHDRLGINETSPLAPLHVTNDQDATTSIRLDNTNSETDVLSTSIDFYDGGTQEAFIGYNNFIDDLIISNNFSANNNIVINARDDLVVKNEGIIAVTIKQVSSSPGVVNIAGLYAMGTGTGNRPVFVEPDGDLVAGDSGSKGPSAKQEERIDKLEQENQMLTKRIEKLEVMLEGLVNNE